MGFHHQAVLYRGEDEFVPALMPFLERALAAGGPALAALAPSKIAALQKELGAHAHRVRFVDLPSVGTNPGAIISLWREFVDAATPGEPVWGVGEPVWPERTGDELEECFRHECFLNLAFADTPSFRLLCPYDTDALTPEVVDRALVSHPLLIRDGIERSSRRYRHPARIEGLLGDPLPEPEAPTRDIAFDDRNLQSVRRFVLAAASEAGLAPPDARDLGIAVHELASNSASHGGGEGRLRAWQEGARFVCEVSDGGHIEDQLAGRMRPPVDDAGGFGLWMVNQVCDLVQVRSTDDGTVVRVQMRTDP